MTNKNMTGHLASDTRYTSEYNVGLIWLHLQHTLHYAIQNTYWLSVSQRPEYYSLINQNKEVTSM